MRYLARLTTVLAIVSLILSPQGALATFDWESAYDSAIYHSEYYDTTPIDAVCTPSSDTSAPVAGAGNVPALDGLGSSEIARINQNLNDYRQASQLTGIPWQFFVALDYREDGNNPDKSMLGGEPLGTPSVDHPNLSPKTKLESILMGAKILQGLAKDVYGVDVTKPMTPDQIKQAFIVYNRGYAYKKANTSPDLSPYVMNNFDAAHKDMVFPDIPGETLAGMREIGRLGGFTLYSRLPGGGAGCNNASGSKIVDLAMAELGSTDSGKYGASPGQSWCAIFVSWIYKQAGKPLVPPDVLAKDPKAADTQWKHVWAVDIYYFMQQYGVAFKNDSDAGRADTPQPGDIVYFDWSGNGTGARDTDHIAIVISTQGDTLKTIGGNQGGGQGEVSIATYPNFRNNSMIIGWGRLK